MSFAVLPVVTPRMILGAPDAAIFAWCMSSAIPRERNWKISPLPPCFILSFTIERSRFGSDDERVSLSFDIADVSIRSRAWGISVLRSSTRRGLSPEILSVVIDETDVDVTRGGGGGIPEDDDADVDGWKSATGAVWCWY